MADRLDMLFDEWAQRYRRGEGPDLREYLDRAGPERDAFAGLVDRFLQAAPAPEPAADRVALARAWTEGQPPLLQLRVERGVRRDEVVDALVAGLGLDPSRRERVKERLHELETGQLEPRRVDRRVLETIAATLSARVADLLAWRPLPAPPQTAYFRASEAISASIPSAPAADRGEADEIDELFGVGRSAH
jgi:hypothetical protein